MNTAKELLTNSKPLCHLMKAFKMKRTTKNNGHRDNKV